jgi:hypothetical protein
MLNIAAGCGLEVRVIGGEVVLQPMRLGVVLGPDAPPVICEMSPPSSVTSSRIDQRGAVRGRVLGRSRKHVCLDAIGHLVAFAPRMANKKPVKRSAAKRLLQ